MNSVELRYLIVAMPAYDEASTVAAVIDQIPRSYTGIGKVELVVVDDGSRDGTAEIARQAGAHVIRHAVRLGVGAAFQSAVRYAIEARADVLATLDSDGQFNPEDLSQLVAPIVHGEADAATASRFIDPARIPVMPRAKLWGNRQLSRVVSRLCGRRFYDVTCGMRSYSRKALLNLNVVGQFTYTQEVLLNLSFKHLRIVEIPIAVRGERSFGKSRVANNLFLYAVHVLRIIWKSYRDYRPFRFFGLLGVALAIPAFLLAAFLLGHYLRTNHFTPHKWAGFAAAALGALSVMMFYAGMIGDMLVRHRIYLEELLYLTRDGQAENSRVPPAPTPIETDPESGEI